MQLNVRLARIGVGAVLAVGLVALGFTLFAGSSQHQVKAANNCQYFPETNHQVCGAFLDYFNSHGQVPQQGFPISDVFAERNQDPPAGDGKVHNVQYFQRARFEEHTESATNPVQLGLLGSEQYKSKYSGTQPVGAPQGQALTINSKTTVSSIGGVSAASGNVFIVVDVSLTNSSGNAIRSSASGFSLSNGQPLLYFASPETYNLDNAWSPSILAQNATQRGKVAFEVPANFQPVTLNFTYSDSFKASSNF